MLFVRDEMNRIEKAPQSYGSRFSNNYKRFEETDSIITSVRNLAQDLKNNDQRSYSYLRNIKNASGIGSVTLLRICCRLTENRGRYYCDCGRAVIMPPKLT